MLSTVACKNHQDKPVVKEQWIQTELQDIQDWFNAWELVSTDLLKIGEHKPPVMLFFDKEFLFTNSDKEIGNGVKINGPDFFGKKLPWTKIKHNDTIQIPTGQKLPIGLLSFAVPIDKKENKPFFVMALPSYWESKKVVSKKLGNKNFYTSIFLHEFAHTQQSNNFGKQLDKFARTYNFENNLNDDMIQREFAKNSFYVSNLKSEIDIFYKAYWSKDTSDLKQLVKEGLRMYKQRQKRYFTGKKEIYKDLDNFFLTMEGIGQYVAFYWLTSKEGANLSAITAIEGLRRNKDNWAQEESLALFLIYTKITNPDLGKEMFENELLNITNLIDQRLE